MHASSFRRLSHAPLLRALVLLAWLAMAGVPAVASAHVLAGAMHGQATSVHAPAPAHAGDCCHGGHCSGQGMGACQACVAAGSGLVPPASFCLASIGFAAPAWPRSSAGLLARTTAPPLRPPRI